MYLSSTNRKKKLGTKWILHIDTRHNSLPLSRSCSFLLKLKNLLKTAHLCLYYFCFPCVHYIDAAIAQNNALWWHVPPGWSILMKLCEIQPIRLLHPSTSTNRPPSCTRFCSWVQFSCCMTALAWTRWDSQTASFFLYFFIFLKCWRTLSRRFNRRFCFNEIKQDCWQCKLFRNLLIIF